MERKNKVIAMFLIFCLCLNSISAVVTSGQTNNNSNITINKEAINSSLEQLGKYVQENTKISSKDIINDTVNNALNNSNNVGKTLEKHGGIITTNLKFRNNAQNTILGASQSDAQNTMLGSSAYDAQYDPRPLNKMTPVRDQGYNSTCWSFASLGAVEAYMKTKSIEIDASEEHARFVLSNNINARNYGRGYINRNPDDGGNFFIAAAYLINGFGFVDESLAPYNGNNYGSWNFSTNLKPTKIVDDIDMDQYGGYNRYPIKSNVVNYGAVDISMCIGSAGIGSETSKYYNATNSAYYYNGTGYNDHEVLIVGWDDNYDRTKFNSSNMPAGNGAWLVKNSWGTDFGDNGYFWVSYYDTGLCNPDNIYSSVANVENVKVNEKFLTNSELGVTDFLEGETYKATTLETYNLTRFDDRITEVTIFSPEYGVNYIVYLVKLDGIKLDGNIFFSSTKVAEGMFTTVGYKTIKLETPYIINEPGTYGLMVGVSDDDNRARIIPVETSSNVYNTVSSPGQSYYYSYASRKFIDFSAYGYNFVSRLTVEKQLTSGDYNYILDNNNIATIAGYNGNATSITIPTTLDGYTVQGIKNKTFLTSAGKNKTLKSITVPEGIKTIEQDTFSNCEVLENITLPSTVTSLEGVLRGAGNLKTITLASHANYVVQDNILYSKDMTKLVQYALNKMDTTYTMPASITKVGYGALTGVKNLEELTLSDNLVTLEGVNFVLNGDKIKNIYTNNNSLYSNIDGVLVTKDGKSLVSYPSGRLEASYTIPSSIEIIKSYAFYNSRNLTTLIIPIIPKNFRNMESYAITRNSKLSTMKVLDNAPHMMYDSILYNASNFTVIRYGWKTGFDSSDWIQYNIISILGDLGTHWSRDIILKWIDRGITSAHSVTNLYYPDQPILKADLMYTINRLMKYTDKVDNISSIKDVSGTDWYYADVQKSIKAGYVYPMTGNNVYPNSTVTREQFMVMMSRALKLPTANLNVLDKFADKDSITASIKQEVANYVGAFGFSGNTVNGKLCLIPQNILTKADAFYFIDKAFNTYDNPPVVNNVANDTINHWSKDIIESLIDRGITSSHNITKCFYPNDYILKSDLIYTINRMMKFTELATGTEMSKYTDVNSSNWFYADMQKAVKAGYIYPLGESSINPNSTVNREQVFVMLSRALNLPTADLSVLDKYTDKDKITESIKQEVANYIGAFGFGGNMVNGKLCLIPQNVLTKADLMYFIYNALPQERITVTNSNKSLNVGDTLNIEVTLSQATVTGDTNPQLSVKIGTGSEVLVDATSLVGNKLTYSYVIPSGVSGYVSYKLVGGNLKGTGNLDVAYSKYYQCNLYKVIQ